MKTLSAARKHTNEERGGSRDPGVRRPGAGRGQLPAPVFPYMNWNWMDGLESIIPFTFSFSNPCIPYGFVLRHVDPVWSNTFAYPLMPPWTPSFFLSFFLPLSPSGFSPSLFPCPHPPRTQGSRFGSCFPCFPYTYTVRKNRRNRMCLPCGRGRRGIRAGLCVVGVGGGGVRWWRKAKRYAIQKILHKLERDMR